MLKPNKFISQKHFALLQQVLYILEIYSQTHIKCQQHLFTKYFFLFLQQPFSM